MTRHVLSAGWAWNPDKATIAAIGRGKRKVKAFESKRHEEIMTMATSKAASTKKTARKTTAKKGKGKKVAKKVAAKKTGNGHISLKELLGKKMDPKIARRKLRAEGFGGHSTKARWEFTPAQAKKAREILEL